MSDKKITTEKVKYIAKLSKLKVSDDELEYYASEMEKMINHFDIISKVDTSDVEPMTHVSNFKNIKRSDNEKKSLKSSDAIKNAPETFGRFIKIPKILD
tara:strand:- start:722 stop:1018 length:297 start_codon:yes stop_codon:yes gene_type:complete